MIYTDKKELHQKINDLNNDYKRSKSEEKNILKHCKNVIAIFITKPLSEKGYMNKEKPKNKLSNDKLTNPIIENNPSIGIVPTRSQSTGNRIKIIQIQDEKIITKEEKNQSNKINQTPSQDKKLDERLDEQYKQYISGEENNRRFSETKIIYEEKNNVSDLMDIYNSMSYYVEEKSEDFLYLN